MNDQELGEEYERTLGSFTRGLQRLGVPIPLGVHGLLRAVAMLAAHPGTFPMPPAGRLGALTTVFKDFLEPHGVLRDDLRLVVPHPATAAEVAEGGFVSEEELAEVTAKVWTLIREVEAPPPETSVAILQLLVSIAAADAGHEVRMAGWMLQELERQFEHVSSPAFEWPETALALLGPLEVAPPVRTGKPVEVVSLKGKLVPFLRPKRLERAAPGLLAESLLSVPPSPVLLSIPGSTDYFLPCFSSASDLRKVLRRGRAAFDQIMQIDDGPSFLESIPPTLDEKRVRVIVDIRYLPNGRVRFLEVLRT